MNDTHPLRMVIRRRRAGLLLALLGAALTTVPGAAPAQEQQTLQIKGSDTMVNLVQAWAEAFMERHSSVFVAVTGGGSGTGIASLIGRTCDIAACSRAMKDQELDQARAAGVEPLRQVVALDGIAVVVHPGHPVTRLTLDQLRQIFTGAVANWQAVGGRNERIVLLSREVNSGTHVFFKEHVLEGGGHAGAEFAPAALLLPSSQAVADEVAHNTQAIGYYGMGYISAAQQVIAVGRDAQGPFVEPTVETVRGGTYPIARPLYLYTNGRSSAAAQQFMDFVMSPEGQRIVADQDFVPLQ